jgi:hypothetical protein
MADAKDPADLFREMLGHWERTSNELVGKMLQSSEFSRSMNNATTLSLKLQQTMHEQMTRFLAALNMPSREEVASLGAGLRAIDERLTRIEAMLAASTGASAAPARERPRPPRTRKPAAKA